MPAKRNDVAEGATNGRTSVRSKPRMSVSDYDNKMEERSLTLDGSQFIPDDTPMQPPLGFIKQPSMVEHVRNMIRSEQLRQAAEQAGAESFEEADDFDLEDADELPHSRYEMEDNFEPPVAAEPANEPASTPASVGPGPTPSPAGSSPAASPAPGTPPSAPNSAST